MKSDVFHILHTAAAISLRKDGVGIGRKAIVGAISFGKSGSFHHSYNGGGGDGNRTPCGHAEARLCLKIKKGAPEVYVARTLRNGDLELARPCPTCYAALKNKKVQRVFYSINENKYGVIDFTRNGEEWVIEKL